MPHLTHRQADEAALALLKALGVTDTDGVVGFVLECRCDALPRLTVERVVGERLADRNALAAASALAPVTEDRVTWGDGR